MNWIFELIKPVIKDCESPDEAEEAVRIWGKFVHPRDAVMGLIAVWYVNANWEYYKNKYNSKP